MAAGSIPATVLTIWVLSLMPGRTRAQLALFPSDRSGTDHRRCRNLPSPPYTELCSGSCRRSHANTLFGPITVVFGALLGVLVPLCSVGRRAGRGRSVLLYPRLPPARIVGSDLAHAVPLTLVAELGHWLIGDVDWHIVGSLLLGSLPGIYFGSHIAAQVPDRILLPVLASILMLIGLRLIAW